MSKIKEYSWVSGHTNSLGLLIESFFIYGVDVSFNVVHPLNDVDEKKLETDLPDTIKLSTTYKIIIWVVKGFEISILLLDTIWVVLHLKLTH